MNCMITVKGTIVVALQHSFALLDQDLNTLKVIDQKEIETCVDSLRSVSDSMTKNAFLVAFDSP